MRRRTIFDAVRRLLRRGLRKAEVVALDTAIDAAESGRDPAKPRRIGPAGIALIKRFEGCARRLPDGHFAAYPDPGTGGAPWTIGWGATGHGIGPGTVWTQAQCDARLEADLVRYAAEVADTLGDAPVSQAQFDALVSFHYNTGAIRRATLTRKHIAGDYAGAAAEFARWNRAGGRVLSGLVRRRVSEAALYQSATQPDEAPEPAPRCAVVSSSGDKPMFRFIGAAALALAAASPVFAQGKGNGNDKDRDGGTSHASVKHGGDLSQRSRDDDDHGRDDQGGQKDRAVRKAQKIAAEAGIRADVSEVRNLGDVRIVRDRREDDNDDGDRDDGNRDDDRGDTWAVLDRAARDRVFASVPSCPPGLAKKNNGCLPPGLAKQGQDRLLGYEYRPALFGIPLRGNADYTFYDGYLIPIGGARASYVPLLGGALAVGRSWPQAYPSLQLADWQRGYYGFDDPRDYRYADNVVYRVDPDTAAIELVAALLTGSDFTVGERVPDGYDIYNLPGPYRERYPDNDQALYRYADGRVYEIDPTTMLIARAIDLVL